MKDHVDKKRKATYPEQPWLWREDWMCGQLVHTKISWFKFFLTLFLISLPHMFVWLMTIWGIRVKGPEIELIIVATFFLIVSGAFPIATILAKRDDLKYGNYAFELDTTPAVLGKPLSGMLRVGSFPISENGFKATLTCTRLPSSTDIGWSEDLWEAAIDIPKELIIINDSEMTIPVSEVSGTTGWPDFGVQCEFICNQYAKILLQATNGGEY